MAKAWEIDPLALRIIRCYLSDDRDTQKKDLPFRAHEFEKRYAGYVPNPPLHYPKQLAGLMARENYSEGHVMKPPLLIGNTERALQVLQNGCEKPLNVQTFNLCAEGRLTLKSKSHHKWLTSWQRLY